MAVAANASTENSTEGNDNSGTPNSSDSAIDALQTSFSNLLTANGASGSGATLQNFLQTLSQEFQGTSSTGNVINTVG